MKRIIAAVAVFAWAAGGIGSAVAQHDVPHFTTHPGGLATTGNWRMYGVIGQHVSGVTSETSNIHEIGYVAVVKNLLLSSLVAVAISSFHVEAERDGVLLSWTIASADGFRGYNIYRSRSGDGRFSRLNAEMIPASAGMTYRDSDVLPGVTYWYQLGAVDRDGEFRSTQESVTTPIWETELHQNWPNPFNPSTTIGFYMRGPGRVTLEVYDTRGKIVRTLVDGVRGFGPHEVTWNGRNDRGNPVGSGVYFYRLSVGKKRFTKKLTLLK